MTAITTHSPMHPATTQRGSAAAQTALPHPTSWADRLAAWAERQPTHRRLGCWTVS
jgi:hypothetical protein